MLIELKIKRNGGSHVAMPVRNAPDTPYHFIPRADGAHVADVTDSEHIRRFLSIPEYRAYEGAVVPAMRVTPPVADTAPAMPVDKVGAVSALLEHTADSLSNHHITPPPSAPASMESMTLAELQTLFLAETGDRAHPRAKRETLIAKINTARGVKAPG